MAIEMLPSGTLIIFASTPMLAVMITLPRAKKLTVFIGVSAFCRGTRGAYGLLA